MKVVVEKKTGLFGHYLGNGQFAVSENPYIFPDTMNKEMFIKYVKESEGCELQIENFEIKNVELVIFD